MSIVGDDIRERRTAERKKAEAQIGVEQTSRALWMHARDLRVMRREAPQFFDCIVMDDIVSARDVLDKIIKGVV